MNETITTTLRPVRRETSTVEPTESRRRVEQSQLTQIELAQRSGLVDDVLEPDQALPPGTREPAGPLRIRPDATPLYAQPLGVATGPASPERPNLRHVLEAIENDSLASLSAHEAAAAGLRAVADTYGLEVHFDGATIEIRPPASVRQGNRIQVPNPSAITFGVGDLEARHLADTTDIALRSIMATAPNRHDLLSVARTFYQAAMETLDDEYASYFERSQGLSPPDRRGITGLEVFASPRGGWVARQPAEDSPAARAGIVNGARVLAINGYSLSDLSFDELSSLRAQADTVTYQIGDNAPITRPLEHGDFTSDAARPVEFDEETGIAHVSVTTFLNPGMSVDLHRTLLGYGDDLKGLVIDFRQNGGGYRQQSLDTLNLFLSGGTAYWIHGRSGTSEARMTGPDAPFAELPVVVLVDGGSASASEVVTGALADRAIVVGTETFGKLANQRVIPLGDGRYVRLTTHELETVSGRAEGLGYVPHYCTSGLEGALTSYDRASLRAALVGRDTACGPEFRLDQPDEEIAKAILADPALYREMLQQQRLRLGQAN